MERAREGRRGGGGVPVSAHRRPRTTGFKDSPVRDDDEITDDTHNPRLRERGKKDNLVSVISGTVLRNKRKMLEMQVPAQSSTVDDVDESSDDTDGGVSEEDDDPPPKIPRWYKPKSSKSHEEGIGLDLPAVPRKARSAIVKRHQESPQPPNTSTPPHQSSSSPAPSNKPSSSATLKPGRRMKSNGSKPRAAKVPKSSPAAIISEQEVEVAEALFDLARTAPNFQKDIKVEPSAFANASQSNVSIPQPAAAPHSAEAPKRKRPRVKPRSDDPTSSTRQGPANVPTPPRDDKGSRVQTSDRMRAESSSKPSVPAAGQSFGAAAAVISSAAVPNTQTPDSQCQDRRSDAATEKNKSSNTAEKRAADPTTPSSNPNPETNKRKFPSLSENRPPKFDIDLMAPPSTSLPLENAETAPSDADGKQPMELKNGSTEMSWLEKECERAREKEREAKGKDKEVTVEGSEVRKENEMFREDKDRECLDLNKQGMVGLRAVKTPRMDMKTAQKPDRSVSAAVVSAASSFLNAASSACATAPALMTWPGGLPSVGYFGPAAVAGTSAVNWPQSAPAANGTADEQALQMNSYVPGRLSWKRCAIHVFIARFIDMQQQLARHTPYGVATGLYTGKPYNLNIPADAMFGGNSTPAAGAAIVPAGSNVSSGVPAAANSQGPKVPYMDALFRKHPQQQQQQQQLAQPPPSLTLQTGPAFGFPVSQAGGGTSNNGGPAISAGLVPSSSGTVAAGGNATVGSPSLGGGGVNNSVATIAAQAQAQAHYFMQHPFPFTYPPSHYGSHNFNAAPNMGQQTTQYMNGPFYASHAMHPSQTPQQGGPTASSSHSTQKQSSRIFPQPQQQQQQVVSSPYNNSQQQVLPLPHAPHDKEVRETSDEKFPTLQRLLFGQQATTTAASPASSAALLGTDTLKTQCIQGGVGGQQATATATSPINLKSMDSNSVATVTRGSVGPGPLGLAPVAAVMAPQGHAVLHSQQHSLQQQQQQQQLQQQQQQPRQQTQAQRTCTEDNHGVTESRDLSEDRKLAVKRAPTIISRVDLESLPVGSPTNSSSRMANAAPAGGITGSVSSRLNIHQTPSNGPSSQSSKQPLVRSSSSKAASSAPPTQSQSTVASSFGDRNSFVPMTRGAGMSFPVQGPMPAQKQSQISQQQLKIQNQRPSVPATGQSVLPNSMQKNHQTQQSRSPQNAASATSSGPVPRISSATSGPPTSACVSMPVSQLPKQNSLVQKGAAPKGSFPVSQKPVSNNVSGKRSPQSTPQQYQSHLSQQQQQQQQQLQQQQQQQHQQQQQQLLQKQQQSLPQFQLRQQMFFQQHYLQQQQQQQHQQQQQPQQHFTSTQQSQLSQSQYQQQQQQQQQGQNGLTMTSQNLSLGAATGNGNHSKANSSSSSASAAAAAANMNARNSSASSLTSAPSTAQSQRALQAGSPNQQATAQVANLPPYTPLKSASSSSDQKSSDGNNQEQQQQQQQQRHRTMLSSSPVNPVRQQQTVTGSTEGYCNGTAAVTVNNYNASSSSCVDAKVNFVTATPSSSHHHQQQLQLQQLQEYVTGITGVSGCTSGSSSSTGLLGQQSSASALRP